MSVSPAAAAATCGHSDQPLTAEPKSHILQHRALGHLEHLDATSSQL